MNFARGERVRVIKDNGRSFLIGYEGRVDSVTQSGVVVILDDDPVLSFRMYTPNGFVRAAPGLVVRRFYQLGEIEKLG